jgi:hypothetical protein
MTFDAVVMSWAAADGPIDDLPHLSPVLGATVVSRQLFP